MASGFALKHNFRTRLAQTFAQNPDIKITLRWDGETKDVVFTQKEVRCGDAIIHWSDYDPTVNKTKWTLLTLLLESKKKFMQKIFGYLNVEDLLALLHTCTDTRRYVEDYLTNTAIHVPDPTENYEENAFQRLVPRIRHLIVDYKTSFRQWQFIVDNATNLIGLKFIAALQPNFLQLDLGLENLKKLSFRAIDFTELQTFRCPRLTSLEILNITTQQFYIGDPFQNLTALKFGIVNDAVMGFLRGLDEAVCNQLIELSLGKFTSNPNAIITASEDRRTEISHIIAQCRKLTILRLIIVDIDKLDFNFIFEHCTNLIDFTVYCSIDMCSYKMFENLKKNCKNIKSIRLVVDERKRHNLRELLLRCIISTFPRASIKLTLTNMFLTFPIDERCLGVGEAVM